MKDSVINRQRVDTALKFLVFRNLFSRIEADKLKSSNVKLYSDPDVCLQLETYSRQMRLDCFLIGISKDRNDSKDLHNFVLRLLCLSHRQATVERDFNVNKELIVGRKSKRKFIDYSNNCI